MPTESDDSVDETGLTRTSEQSLHRLSTNLRTTNRVLDQSFDRTSDIIGVDFGLHSLIAAVWNQGEPHIIPNSEGTDTTPAFVSFKSDAKRLVGNPAKRQAITNPKNTISMIRRLIRRSYAEIEDMAEGFPFEIIADGDELVRVKALGRRYSFSEILGMILHKVKHDAKDYLDREVVGAVVAVPAYYGEEKKAVIRESGQNANLPVKQVIKNPIASSLAYDQKWLDQDKNILFYDLSRSDFHSTVVQTTNGDYKTISHSWTSDIGGHFFTERLVNHLAKRLEKETDINDLCEEPMALQRLKEAADNAKIELSSVQATTVDLPFITATDDGPQHLKMSVTRSTFEELIAPVVEQTAAIISRSLEGASLETKEIDEVILSGASTRIPLVRRRVAEVTGQKPNTLIEPEKTISFGAAAQGVKIRNVS